ncbi:MAG: PDZ domain-containing protein [Chloroflexi bacterium]|nr:PDZ domain-containing protein [Chloroflexota bacterium]
MKKLTSILLGASIALSTVTAGALFAQEATETPDTTVTQAVTVTTRASLGVIADDSSGQIVVASVRSGSAAEAAGLLEGDIITAFNGTAVTTASELRDLVRAAAPGDVVSVDIERDGSAQSVEVTLGESSGRGDGNLGGQRGGMGYAADPEAAAERLLDADIEVSDAGYTVSAIDDDGNALGLEVGDVIVSINGQAIANLDLAVLRDELAAADSPTISVVVTRADAEVTLTGDALAGHGIGRGMDDGQGMPGMDGGNMGRGGRGGRHGGDGMTPPAGDPSTTPVTPEATPESST